mgnify:FL=1
MEQVVQSNPNNKLILGLCTENSSLTYRNEINVIKSSGSTKMQKRQLILKDRNLIRASVDLLSLDFFASSTLSSYVSEIKQYEKICESDEISPWPVSVKSVKTMVGVLKASGYSSIRMYIAAVMSCNLL